MRRYGGWVKATESETGRAIWLHVGRATRMEQVTIGVTGAATLITFFASGDYAEVKETPEELLGVPVDQQRGGTS